MCRFLPFLSCLIVLSASAQYSMPHEESEHEGTWLQWPHNYTYGSGAEDAEMSWVAMTDALTGGERVHIVAYNEFEVGHILGLLQSAEVDLDQVDFHICPNDDFWVRDNGPIFVQDAEGEWVILDWGFNGWGGDTPYELDDAVPASIASALSILSIDLSAMVLEGGAIEIDGNGTLMATRSSITQDDRNPDLTESEIEGYLSEYLGIQQFIWLDGQFGGSEDITDQHIDGFVKFVGDHTVVTMNNSDLAYWYVSPSDRAIIDDAANVEGVPYERVNLPLTQYPVQTTWGQNVGFRSTYVNYYVANEVVLVPNYDDPMDEVANDIVQGLYPNRMVVGINCQNILLWGGMVHCVTQQQPIGAAPMSLTDYPSHGEKEELVMMFDLLGRQLPHPMKGQPYLKVYTSGRVEKVVEWE
jgi:agmatine deiminase